MVISEAVSHVTKICCHSHRTSRELLCQADMRKQTERTLVDLRYAIALYQELW